MDMVGKSLLWAPRIVGDWGARALRMAPRVVNDWRGSVGAISHISRGLASEYSVRSHGCGTIGLEQVGETVTLAGWVQASRMNQFLLVRDRSGLCQVKFSPQFELQKLPNESVVVLKGVVQQRPEGQHNPKMDTGQIEVEMTELVESCNAKSSLPIQQSQFASAKEDVRLQYRYLDLRRPDLQRNLILRSKVMMEMRRFLADAGFLDIETPTLFRRTPGGAKEFVVPTRRKGEFYSLVQSPQQFKQLLMVGGLDRYFQIARCYRDEGGKPDRQPEFTQLDIEMSFAGREEVLKLVEDLLAAVWPLPITTPIQRMTYTEAMGRYGVDKPDLRYDSPIQDLTEHFKQSGFQVIDDNLDTNKDFIVAGVFFAADSAKCLKTVEKELVSSFNDLIKKTKGKEVLIISPCDTMGGTLRSSITKKCSPETQHSVYKCVGPGQVGLLVSGPKEVAQELLGRARSLLAQASIPLLEERPHSFLWVVDFPLFLWEEGQLGAAHHPFTKAHPEDQHKLYDDPLNCRSLHYDLVCDGQEVGGGSVRIHSQEEQRFVIENVLKGQVDELRHLLEALGSGAPPHAGIALGIDRLIAILTRSNSIRDVMAFPKTGDGRDPMSGAPAAITEEQRALYHLKP